MWVSADADVNSLLQDVYKRQSQKLFDLQQKTVGELNGTITELYGGFNEILLYNKQEAAVEKFQDVNERMGKAAFRAQFVSSLISPCISLVTRCV